MQARLTYGAAAAALPQPGTPTVGHTAASLLAVLPSSASGGGNIFFLHLPPSPPPHLLLLLPLLLRTTEVPRVRHRDSQQHGCHRRLPSPPPRPPGARKALREIREGSTHRGAAPLSGFRRFSRAPGAGRREFCACARLLRSRVSAFPPACAPPPSPFGLAAGSALGWGARREFSPGSGARFGIWRRRRGVSEVSLRLCLPAWGLVFRTRLPSASCPVAHCSPPAACAGISAPDLGVLLALRFRGAGTHKSRTVIQAFRFHPYPLPEARRWRHNLGGRVNPLSGLSFS